MCICAGREGLTGIATVTKRGESLFRVKRGTSYFSFSKILTPGEMHSLLLL